MPRAPQQEKPQQLEAGAPQLEKARVQQWRPSTAKSKNKTFYKRKNIDDEEMRNELFLDKEHTTKIAVL